METWHEDDAAFVWLIDLHLPVGVLVTVDLCPSFPPVARSPRSDLFAGGFSGPHPRISGCLDAPCVDEKYDARATDMLHAVSNRDLGPVQSSVETLNNQAPLMPRHQQMICIIGIDD